MTAETDSWPITEQIGIVPRPPDAPMPNVVSVLDQLHHITDLIEGQQRQIIELTRENAELNETTTVMDREHDDLRRRLNQATQERDDFKRNLAAAIKRLEDARAALGGPTSPADASGPPPPPPAPTGPQGATQGTPGPIPPPPPLIAMTLGPTPAERPEPTELRNGRGA